MNALESRLLGLVFKERCGLFNQKTGILRRSLIYKIAPVT